MRGRILNIEGAAVDRRQIEHFLAICETGSISGAARSLDITQPAVSQSMRALESELGVELFHRGRIGMTFTMAGRALAPAAVDIIRSFEAAQAVVHIGSRTLNGMLSIVCPATLVLDPLLEILAEFKRHHPQVRLAILDPRTPAEAAEHVLSGIADCALFSGDHHTPGLVTEVLEQQAIVAVLPPGDKPVDNRITSLLAHGLLCAPRGRTIRRILEEAVGRTAVAHSLVVETEHSGTIVPLVQAGVGIAFLPYAAALQASAQGLRIIEPSPALERSVVLAHREENTSPELDAFLTMAHAGAITGSGADPVDEADASGATRRASGWDD